MIFFLFSGNFGFCESSLFFIAFSMNLAIIGSRNRDTRVESSGNRFFKKPVERKRGECHF
jgi:hypothetical protein